MTDAIASTALGVVPAPSWAHGGERQYSLSILQALDSRAAALGAEGYSLLSENDDRSISIVAGSRRILPLFPPGHSRRLLPALRATFGAPAVSWVGQLLRRRRAPSSLEIRERPHVGRWLKQNGIEFVLWTVSRTLAFECGAPFVMPIHDLEHRRHPEFPEVSQNGERAAREYLFQNAARRATALVADSEQGREDILNAYGEWIQSERVHVLPFVAPPYMLVGDAESEVARARAVFRLPARFLFYPAQFWPHKNHALIIAALGLLRARGRSDIRVVLTGSHSGRIRARTYRQMLRDAARLGVEDQLSVLSYVADEWMAGLYGASAGLVMPTFFGPTNIPVIEAWCARRPVITSDIRGPRDQAGDAALLVDPSSAEDLANAMLLIWDDSAVVATLVEAGTRRTASWTNADFSARLRDILRSAAENLRADSQPIIKA